MSGILTIFPLISRQEEKDIDYIKDIYPNFGNDLGDSLRYLNEDNLHIFPPEIVRMANKVKKMVEFETNEKHRKVTSIILEDLKKKDYRLLTENITRAGFIRGFLG